MARPGQGWRAGGGGASPASDAPPRPRGGLKRRGPRPPAGKGRRELVPAGGCCARRLRLLACPAALALCSLPSSARPEPGRHARLRGRPEPAGGAGGLPGRPSAGRLHQPLGRAGAGGARPGGPARLPLRLPEPRTGEARRGRQEGAEEGRVVERRGGCCSHMGLGGGSEAGVGGAPPCSGGASPSWNFLAGFGTTSLPFSSPVRNGVDPDFFPLSWKDFVSPPPV